MAEEEAAAAASSCRKRAAPEGNRPPAPAASVWRPRETVLWWWLVRSATGSAASTNYEVIGFVGMGTFGMVYKGRRRGAGETVAIKCVRRYGCRAPDVAAVVREGGLMRACNGHPSVVLLFDIATHPPTGDFYFIMEFVDGPCIRNLLTRPVPERRYMRQLLSAADRIHGAPLPTIHRDIKPENILFAGGGRLKICDFGSATEVRPPRTPHAEVRVGNMEYTSPEQLNGDHYYGTAVDIWALGCVMVELVTAAPLFSATTEEDMMQEMKDLFEGSAGIGSKAFEEMLGLSPAGIDLLSGLLKLDPGERLTAAGALWHPWFTEEEAAAAEPAAKAESPGCVPLSSEASDSSSNGGAPDDFRQAAAAGIGSLQTVGNSLRFFDYICSFIIAKMQCDCNLSSLRR